MHQILYHFIYVQIDRFYIINMNKVLIFLVVIALGLSNDDDIICPGNRFIFLSTYALGLQDELTKTFDVISSKIKIGQVVYKEEVFRTYKIFDVKHTLVYEQGKQYAQLATPNVLRITGGNLKIYLQYQWQKSQLGSILLGTGTGYVSSDIITFEKTLYTNGSHELQWNLTKAQDFGITNGIALTIDPYRDADEKILSNMLNKLKNNQTTIKDLILTSINDIYKPILAQKVQQNEAFHYEKVIPYTYSDYRGIFTFALNNTLMNGTLMKEGLYLLFSQVIQGDTEFQCGSVPFKPDDAKYGGLQEYISNNLLKSCLRYTIKKGSLNVILNEQFWQSRAFQFFMGDIHEVMPSSTKKIQTLQQIKGNCTGLDDPVFSLSRKTDQTYQAKVNFACDLTFNQTRLISINIVANYQIKPSLTAKNIDFILTAIVGTPQFIQKEPFKIEYPELAQFMVAETLSLAKGGNVIGSGVKALNRKFPRSLVRQNYLFLYDSSIQSSNIFENKAIQTE